MPFQGLLDPSWKFDPDKIVFAHERYNYPHGTSYRNNQKVQSGEILIRFYDTQPLDLETYDGITQYWFEYDEKTGKFWFAGITHGKDLSAEEKQFLDGIKGVVKTVEDARKLPPQLARLLIYLLDEGYFDRSTYVKS